MSDIHDESGQGSGMGVDPATQTQTQGAEPGADVAGHAEILEHVRKYGTKDGDPRRLYTQCQLELAMRLSVRRALTTEGQP